MIVITDRNINRIEQNRIEMIEIRIITINNKK